MKYYSEITKKVYDTPVDLNKAEKAVREAEAKEKAKKEQLANERKNRANEIEVARKALHEAQKNYRDKLEAFCRDYGTFHYSVDTKEIPTLFDIFNLL